MGWTDPYAYSGFCHGGHIPVLLPKYLALIKPFQLNVMATIFLAVILFIPIFWFFVNKINGEKEFTLSYSFLGLVGILTMQGMSHCNMFNATV